MIFPPNYRARDFGNSIHYFGKFLLSFGLGRGRYSAPKLALENPWHSAAKIKTIVRDRNTPFYRNVDRQLLKIQCTIPYLFYQHVWENPSDEKGLKRGLDHSFIYEATEEK